MENEINLIDDPHSSQNKSCLSPEDRIFCINCGSVLQDNFCSSCGQRADTHRLTFKLLLADLSSGFFSFDRGVLFTYKELLLRPGKLIGEYIQGKRKKYFSPYTLLLITSTFYGLILFLYNTFSSQEVTVKKDIIFSDSENSSVIIDKINSIVQSIFSSTAFSQLIFVPFFALAFCRIFRKKINYNFIESFYAFTFISSIWLLISSVILIAFHWCSFADTIEIVLMALYLYFFIYNLLHLSIGKTFLKTTLFIMLSLGLFIIVFVALILILVLVYQLLILMKYN